MLIEPNQRLRNTWSVYGSQMADNQSAKRLWKCTVVFEKYEQMRLFLASVGAKVSDFSIVDSQGNHLGFDDIVLMMPESIDESQSRLYDTEESEG